MNSFKKNYHRIKNSKFFSRFRATILLLIVLVFLFNFNADNLWVRGQQAAVSGEGIVGFIARWITQILPAIAGEGHGRYLSKWILNTVPTLTVPANQQTIYTGDTATITWSSNTQSCTGTNFSTGGVASGNAVVSPISTTTYTVTCNGQASSPLTITVKKRPRFIEN